MVESFLAVPVHFTIEFLGFLVTAGGAILVLSRPGLIPGELSSRVAVSLGLFVLAATEVAHGGSFSGFELDGATILVASRTLGLAFILVGLAGSLRTGAAVAAGKLKLEEPVLLAPAGAALLVAIVALYGSRGSGPKSLRRLALAMLFLAGAEVLTAVAPASEFGAGVVSIYAYAAHGLKALSFIFMGAWFWTAVRSSIRTRFVAAFAALLVAVVLALSSALTGVISANVQEGELKQVSGQLKGALEDLDQETRLLKKDVGEVAEFTSDEVSSGVSGNTIARSEEIEDIFDFDFVMVMNPAGRVTGFVGEGPTIKRKGDVVPTELTTIDKLEINGSAVIDDVAKRDAPFSASPTQVGDQSVALMAAHEIVDPGNPSRRIGIVAAGNYIDALAMEGISSTLRPARASLIVDGQVVASELPGKPKKRLVPADVKVQVTNGSTVARQIVVGARSYSTAFAPLQSSGGDSVAILALSSPARVVVAARQGLTSILFLVAMGVGAVALALAWLSGRRITRPIQELTATAGAIREGNLGVQASVSGTDEVGQLGETFNEMTSSLFKMTNDLRDAALEEGRLRARIETIIESMADGLVAVDASKRVLAFNREAEHLTGIEAGDAIGKPIEDVLKPRDSQGQPVRVPVFDLSPGSVDGIHLERRNGGSVPVTMVSAPLPGDEGEASGGVIVIRDMSREREVERMKTEFLSNISHELRTPLTPIKGYAEILGRKGIPPEKVHKFADGILESTGRLERIVQLLVDFSAMEAGRLAPRSKAIDISAIVEGLATEWAGRTDRHDIVTDITDGVPLVLGDEGLLKRSLEEVIDNAVKFSPSGGTVRLGVTCSGNGLASLEVEVSVTDEGIGIPPEDIPKIFSDFRQLDGSETRTFGGLGLGLAFVQRIVQAHDGSVRVESRPDQGTTLTIVIPAASQTEG